MSWYSISYGLDEKVSGVEGQIKELHRSASIFGSESKDALYDEPVKSKAILDYAELKSKAKLTDIIWSYPGQFEGLLFSNKLKSILDNYNLSEHQFKPAILKKGTKQFSDNWFRMYGDMTPLLDFKKSIFGFRNNSTDVSTEVKYENMNAFSSAKKQATITFDRIRNKELFLMKHFMLQITIWFSLDV